MVYFKINELCVVQNIDEVIQICITFFIARFQNNFVDIYVMVLSVGGTGGYTSFTDVGFFQTFGPIQAMHVCYGWYIDS